METQHWDEVSNLGLLRSVLDPLDQSGFKNSLLDRIQWKALHPHVSGAKSLLDFGCGTGRFAERLHQLGMHYSGVDSSQGMINAAQSIHSNKELEFHCFDGANLPFKDGEFDACLTVGVLQHIMHTPAAPSIVTEIRRVLQPGSRFVMIEQASLSNHSSSSVAHPSTEQEYIEILSPHFKVESISRVRMKGGVSTSGTLMTLAKRFPRLLSFFINIVGVVSSLFFQILKLTPFFEILLNNRVNKEIARTQAASEQELAACQYYDILIHATAKNP